MKIIEGGLPEGTKWRALLLLSPGIAPTTAVLFGAAMADVYGGDLVTAVLLHEATEERIAHARDTLNEVQHLCEDDLPTYRLIIQSPNFRRTANELIRLTDIDLVVLSIGEVTIYRPEQLSATVATVFERGEPVLAEHVSADVKKAPFQHILVPTSGGPNTAQALRLMVPLTGESEITACYITQTERGPNEEALGHSRLRQVLSFVDASERITRKLTSADSIIDGILQEASKGYDLVVLGASRESPFDRALFGNIPETISRRSQVPVVVVYQNPDQIDNLVSAIAWRLQQIVPRLPISVRTEIYVRVRRAARPNIDFSILIGLSALIAAIGLLLSSPAVVIGAMVVAPLMSPMVGIGMAIVLGDVRFLRLALGTTLRGALLALALSALMGLFELGSPLTPEILARTRPSLLDLGVALFAGMAGAYAIAHSDAAAALPGVAIAAATVPPLSAAGVALVVGEEREMLGALLLFATNLTAISSASALVFLVLGFRPSPGRKMRQALQARSARVALGSLTVITIMLITFTLPLAREKAWQERIAAASERGVEEILDALLVTDPRIEGEIANPDEALQLGLTVQSTHPIPHARVVELQEFISGELQRRVGLTVRVIHVTVLDPVVPPTPMPTGIP